MTEPTRVPDVGPIGWVIEWMPEWLWQAVLRWSGVTDEAIDDLFNPMTDRESD